MEILKNRKSTCGAAKRLAEKEEEIWPVTCAVKLVTNCSQRGLMHTSSDEEMGDIKKFISEQLKN